MLSVCVRGLRDDEPEVEAYLVLVVVGIGDGDGDLLNAEKPAAAAARSSSFKAR